ncbi:MAG: ChrR family anti-sigma-E factor [Rhodomicrobiaceae bacterium]
MTIRNHPDPSILMSYAAGTLPNAIACVVVCHVSMCSECGEAVRRLEMLGGLMLDRLGPGAADEAMAERAEAIVAGEPSEFVEPEQSSKEFDDPFLPEPLARYLGMTGEEIPWKRLPKGVQQYWIKLPKDSGLIRLLKVPPHLKLLEHSHDGMELTMVLRGTYSDHTGDYLRGDVTEMNAGTEHRPASTGEEECICIVASETPPRYSRWYARMLQPILRY